MVFSSISRHDPCVAMLTRDVRMKILSSPDEILPLQCSMCSRTYVKKGHLDNHMRAKHNHDHAVMAAMTKIERVHQHVAATKRRRSESRSKSKKKARRRDTL